MKGSVRKRGSTWSYYFDLGKIDGKRQKKEKGGFATKKEAETALADAINRYNNTGQIFTQSEITVSDYLDQWFRLYVQMNLKYNTQLDYERIIRNHLKPAFGKYRLRTMTPALIQEYINGLKVQGYARSTAFNIFRCLSGSFNYAVEPLNYIEHNPCDRVKFPRYENKRQELHVVLTEDVMKQVLERFPEGSPYYVPIMIGYYTGVRISECFALTWDDIDLDNQTLAVNKQLIKRNGVGVNTGKKRISSDWYFGSTKTASSVRTIKFGPSLLHVLEHAKHEQKKNRILYGSEYTEYCLKPEQDEKGETIQHILPVKACIPVNLPKIDFVCIRDDGTMITSDSFKYVCRIVKDELHLQFNYHSLRHTHATMLIEAGADVKDVQERLGHSNIQTTLNKYVHNTDDMKNKTVDLFEKISLKA